MANPTQAHRQAELRTVLGTDKLVLLEMTGRETVSGLYTFEAVAFSTDDAINPDDLLGSRASVKCKTDGSAHRFFDGYVSEVQFLGYHSEWAKYSLSIVPWFWFLTRTQDCKIFQEMKVPEIFKQVCSDLGFTDIQDRLTGTYEPREYCVQYRESSYDFLTRLLAEEGIYFFFSHSDGKHDLVLADSSATLQPFEHYDSILYFPPDPVHQSQREEEHISQWAEHRNLRTGKYTLTDYDFTAPNKDLKVSSTIQRSHAQASHEVYDYPGEYMQHALGDRYARVRIEQSQMHYHEVIGTGPVRGIKPGHKFTLKQYPRSDQNREYMVLWSDHHIAQGDYHTADSGAAGFNYSCAFSVMPTSEQFRPPEPTRKPLMQGPQTALVVGPPGEEIWPDEYGRIKVQFHWDRVGQKNEHSSCWIRVSQIWAGKQWGAQFLPRIGHEVVVAFLEGDPDQPMVVGSVYNGSNMPPYELPGNKTQSGIKTRSSKDGGSSDYNEIRFEDKRGEEELLFHAQKDMTIGVENCEAHRTGVDRKKHIGRDEAIKVGRDRETVILKDEVLDVEGKRSMKVVGNDLNWVRGSRLVDVSGDQAFEIGSSFGVKANTNIVLDASTITLKCGGSFINISSAGVIIKGSMVLINSGGMAVPYTPVGGSEPSPNTDDPEPPKS